MTRSERTTQPPHRTKGRMDALYFFMELSPESLHLDKYKKSVNNQF